MNEHQQTLWEFMRQQSDKLLDADAAAHRANFYFAPYCGSYRFAIGYLDHPKKAILRYYFRNCGGIANYTKHCTAGLYDPVTGHWR